MKFEKIIVLGIDKSKLSLEHWKGIKKLAVQLVFLSPDSLDLRKQLKEADCFLVNFGVEVNKDLINSASSLKYIGVMATAFGKIDTKEAKKRAIAVCNIPGYSTEAVAEFTFAAILEQLRQLEEGKKRSRDGNCSEVGMSASEIKGKISGIIGLGNIGGRVAEIAQGFGADVRYWSINRKKQRETERGTRD